MGWLSLDGDHHSQSLNISPLIWIASKISQNTCKQKWITGHQLGNDIPPNTEDIYTKNNRKLKDPQMGSLIWEYPYTIIYMYTIITCIYTYIYIYLKIYVCIHGGFRKHPKSFPCHHPVTHLSQPTLVLMAMLATGELAFQPVPAATMRMSKWSSDWMRFDNLDCCSWWYVQTIITLNIYKYSSIFSAKRSLIFTNCKCHMILCDRIQKKKLQRSIFFDIVEPMNLKKKKYQPLTLNSCSYELLPSPPQ